MTDYAYILSRAYAGKEFILNGDKYSGLVWLDASPKPTKKELDDAYTAFKAANSYKDKREKAYPSVREQLDMQYHDSVNGTAVWVTTIAAIKAANPKPQ